MRVFISVSSILKPPLIRDILALRDARAVLFAHTCFRPKSRSAVDRPAKSEVARLGGVSSAGACPLADYLLINEDLGPE